MAISDEKMLTWCQTLLGANPGAPKTTLEQYLSAIPRLDSLADIRRGTPVLVPRRRGRQAGRENRRR